MGSFPEVFASLRPPATFSQPSGLQNATGNEAGGWLGFGARSLDYRRFVLTNS